MYVCMYGVCYNIFSTTVILNIGSEDEIVPGLIFGDKQIQARTSHAEYTTATGLKTLQSEIACMNAEISSLKMTVGTLVEQQELLIEAIVDMKNLIG